MTPLVPTMYETLLSDEAFLDSPVIWLTPGVDANSGVAIDAVYPLLAKRIDELFSELPVITPSRGWFEMTRYDGSRIGWLCAPFSLGSLEAKVAIQMFLQPPGKSIEAAGSAIMQFDSDGRLRSFQVVNPSLEGSDDMFAPVLVALTFLHDGRAIAVQPAGESHRKLVLTNSASERIN